MGVIWWPPLSACSMADRAFGKDLAKLSIPMHWKLFVHMGAGSIQADPS